MSRKKILCMIFSYNKTSIIIIVKFAQISLSIWIKFYLLNFIKVFLVFFVVVVVKELYHKFVHMLMLIWDCSFVLIAIKYLLVVSIDELWQRMKIKKILIYIFVPNWDLLINTIELCIELPKRAKWVQWIVNTNEFVLGEFFHWFFCCCKIRNALMKCILIMITLLTLD